MAVDTVVQERFDAKVSFEVKSNTTGAVVLEVVFRQGDMSFANLAEVEKQLMDLMQGQWSKTEARLAAAKKTK